MASKIPVDDWNFYKRVINKNWSRFLSDLEPIAILDVFLETEYIDEVKYRDISELPITSDKVRKILDLVSKKGPKGYNDFKECLKKSGQEHLAALLEQSEKELIKKQREEAAKKEAENADRLAKARRLMSKKSGDTKKTPPGDDSRLSQMVPKPIGKKELNIMQRESNSTNTDMGKATERDLMRIADEAVGQNWELIAPFLDVDNNTLARIKADNPTSMSQQIFKMLIAWSRRLGSKATLNRLESSMREAPSSVTIKWKVFDDLRKQRPSEIRSSEPVSATSHSDSYQGMTTDVSQRMTDLSISDVLGEMGKTRRQGEDFSNPYQPDYSNISNQNTRTGIPQNVNQSQLQTNDGNDSGEDTAGPDERRDKDGNDEPDAKRLNSNIFSLPSANVISKPAQKPEDRFSIIRQHLIELENEQKGIQTVTPEPVITPNTPTNENGHKPPVKKLDITDGPGDTKCFEGQNEEKGRLKILDNNDIECLQLFCCEEIGSGGFGYVYKSKKEISGLDINVVLKKIVVKNDEDQEKMRSITNEKLASRTMHFAIVPLFAYGAAETNQMQERAFYFITPYLEKGDLAKAIQNDNASRSPVLTLPLRMKIMYHIASAIHFLHTPVNKFRGTILHMDIKSLNIVLDQWYNARLIDFGLSREMEEDSQSVHTTKLQIPHTKGYFKTITYSQLTVYADYYNFGVVIRELLTGRKPFDDRDGELRNLSRFLLKRRFMTLWKDSEGKPFPVTDDLIKLSEQCLEKKDITSKEILDIIQKLVADKFHSTWDNDRKGKKCDMCMRYDAVDDTILQHNEKCKMKVCVSCMRHSYCNPILCHTCGEEIIPNIGYGWDAVLIAGNDLEDTELAEMFSKDVEVVRKVITSKSPLVMGISEERVHAIKPKTPGTSENMKTKLTNQLKRCLSDNPEGKQKTFVLYFSGHYFRELGFQLGNEDDLVTIEELQKLLLGTEKTADRCVRLVIFLDCCCAPGVEVDNLRDNKDDVILVQMNACSVNSQAYTDKTAGSLFQRFFTQALTGRALSSKCMNENCKDCCIDNDFVTLYNIHGYIDKHYKEYDSQLSRPRVHVRNADFLNMCIGYVVNFSVDLEFNFKLKNKEEKKDFPNMFSNIEELRTVLFDEYLKMLLAGSTEQGPQLSTTYFRDILFIFTKTGPKSNHRFELDTIEKVNIAWDCRRQLHVSLRDVSAGTDLVGGFFDETSVKAVLDYLFKNGTKKEGDENTVDFTTNLEDFLEFLDEQSLNDVVDIVEGLYEAKDKLGEKVNVTNLGVKLPYDERVSPKYRTDFLCFYLQVDSQDERMQ